MLRFQSVQGWPSSFKPVAGAALVATIGLGVAAAPALAHHPFGGAAPTNIVEGFASGLGHPVVGLDHLAFVVAAGLLAAVMGRISIPVTFVLASLAGTGIHLLGVDLPAAEVCISASVLLFGSLLAMKQQPQVLLVVALSALAGVFHGYAYGEAVIGAEMSPLLAYLLGFTAIQMAISMAAYWVAKRLGSRGENPVDLRFAGFILAGAGGALLSGVLLG